MITHQCDKSLYLFFIFLLHFDSRPLNIFLKFPHILLQTLQKAFYVIPIRRSMVTGNGTIVKHLASGPALQIDRCKVHACDLLLENHIMKQVNIHSTVRRMSSHSNLQYLTDLLHRLIIITKLHHIVTDLRIVPLRINGDQPIYLILDG